MTKDHGNDISCVNDELLKGGGQYFRETKKDVVYLSVFKQVPHNGPQTGPVFQTKFQYFSDSGKCNTFELVGETLLP